MNHFNYLILILSNGDQIRYQVENTPVTWAWTDILKKYYLDGDNIFDLENQIKKINYNFKPSIPEYWEKIKQICDYLNQQDYDFKIHFVVDETYTVEQLNELHKNFHYISEKHEYHKIINPDSMISKSLSSLNLLIHDIEYDLAKMSKSSEELLKSGYYGCQLVESHRYHSVITDEQRQLFTLPDNYVFKNGDMALGYGTIGKKLIDAVTNNDFNLVRERSIRPQQMIKNVFSISLGVDRGLSVKRNYLKTKRWLDKYYLSEYINPLDPEHYYNIQPLLARTVKDYSILDLNKILFYNNIVEFEIE
jgi:hypothetical protein